MVQSAKDLGEALKRGDDSIEIEGNLKESVIKIKATGKGVWAVCVVCIGVTIGGVAVAVGSGGTGSAPAALISTPAMASAVAILGAPVVLMSMNMFAGIWPGMENW